MSQGLENALGLSPMPVVVDSNLPVVQTDGQAQADVDAEVESARTNLQDAISLSQQAVQDMLNIAQQSQHPKAYEVLNSMIKTYADISMGLVDLQAKKQRLTGQKPAAQEGSNVTNNNLFVGSTAEMLKILEDMKNKGTE